MTAVVPQGLRVMYNCRQSGYLKKTAVKEGSPSDLAYNLPYVIPTSLKLSPSIYMTPQPLIDCATEARKLPYYTRPTCNVIYRFCQYFCDSNTTDF